MINNDTNARLLQNHVRCVRWVLFQTGFFALFIRLLRFCIKLLTECAYSELEAQGADRTERQA